VDAIANSRTSIIACDDLSSLQDHLLNFRGRATWLTVNKIEATEANLAIAKLGLRWNSAASTNRAM
jgi:hypothetical protein